MAKCVCQRWNVQPKQIPKHSRECMAAKVDAPAKGKRLENQDPALKLCLQQSLNGAVRQVQNSSARLQGQYSDPPHAVSGSPKRILQHLSVSEHGTLTKQCSEQFPHVSSPFCSRFDGLCRSGQEPRKRDLRKSPRSADQPPETFSKSRSASRAYLAGETHWGWFVLVSDPR